MPGLLIFGGKLSFLYPNYVRFSKLEGQVAKFWVNIKYEGGSYIMRP